VIKPKKGKIYEVTARVKGELETVSVKASNELMAIGVVMDRYSLSERDIIEICG